MEEKNELNDIILNKGGGDSSNKKIVLAVATLGIVLIVVVLLMNTLTSNGTNNLPQAILPPEPKSQTVMQEQEEPLFEEVEVIEEDSQNSDNLDKIAQRLKEESIANKEVVTEKQPTETVKNIPQKVEPKKEVVKKEEPKKVEAPKKQEAATKAYYVQVGSFSKYEPNKNFLKSITSKGYKYKYHAVTKNSKTINKVLVGPFKNEREARDALREIRSSVEAGAFLVKI